MFDESAKLREEILGPDFPDTRMAAQALQRCRGTAMVKLDAASRQRVDSALWSAAAAGNATMVRKMLHAGANPDIESNGFPALCVSAISGHADAVQMLCEGGAEPDAVVKAEGDVCGATAMYLAAHGGHASIIELLVEAGGTVDGAIGPQSGCTPLYMAADTGHTAAVQALLAAGADVLAPVNKPLYTATHRTVMDLKRVALQMWAGAGAPNERCGCVLRLRRGEERPCRRAAAAC